MCILRWICGHIRMDRIRNDDIRDRLGVAPIEEKLVQHRLRWFSHVQRRPSKAPVHCRVVSRDINVRRARGRPKLTWKEAIKRDLKGWDISRDPCWVSTLVYPNLLGTKRLYCCCCCCCCYCTVFKI
jgi:hypothetical protein